MIVDGNQIASEIKREISAKVLTFEEPPTLSIFYDEENTVGSMYVGRKEAFANEIKIKFEKLTIPPEETTEQLAERVKQKSMVSDGVIVQLPLPARFDTEKVLAAILPEADTDLLSPESFKRFEAGISPLLPPVVGGIKVLIDRFTVKLEGMHAVVVGEGKLVGGPAAIWLRKKGARVVALNENTPDISSAVKTADMIVLGTGSPSLLTPDMIKDDVIIIDAGSSVREGKVVGDASPACAEKAKIFTPVPGGMGPLGVACAFQNLLHLAEENGKREKRGK